MDKDELLFRLASAIAEDPALTDHDWDTVSVVFATDEDMVSWYCYSYRGTEPHAVTLESDEFDELLLAFQAETASPDGSTWKTCLFQLDGRSGEFQMDFEHVDVDRWKVTPDTINTIHNRIRLKKAVKKRASVAKKRTPAAKKRDAKKTDGNLRTGNKKRSRAGSG
jgi:hypothetical protein